MNAVPDSFGNAMREIIALRQEIPETVAVQDASHDAAVLYRFADGAEVIETNAGTVAEGDDGFSDLRAIVVG